MHKTSKVHSTTTSVIQMWAHNEIQRAMTFFLFLLLLLLLSSFSLMVLLYAQFQLPRDNIKRSFVSLRTRRWTVLHPITSNFFLHSNI